MTRLDALIHFVLDFVRDMKLALLRGWWFFAFLLGMFCMEARWMS